VIIIIGDFYIFFAYYTHLTVAHFIFIFLLNYILLIPVKEIFSFFAFHFLITISLFNKIKAKFKKKSHIEIQENHCY
jgi:hypothetical protein